ncbi:hypothetical protein [Rhodopila sp.]|uniref:hypothetical protein n=1 Tax=Rhodopila sp. TaxID=2480087 RepID=UPI003D0CEE71
MRRSSSPESTNVKMLTYPGALHGFDATAPLHFYVGHGGGGVPATAANAKRQVRQFLATRLVPR